MEYKLSDLAEKFGLEHIGEDMVVTGVNTLDKAQEGDISFLVNPKYVKELETTQAGCVITSAAYADMVDRALVSDNIYMDLAKIVELFAKPQGCLDETSPLAYIHPDAQVDSTAIVYPFAFIGAGAVIGAKVKVFPGCYIGEDTVIGANSTLYPNAVIMGGMKIGKNVIIQPGAIIGGDGYGYAQTPVGHMKIPQVGIVELGDNVEIGSNTAIDRAALDVTKVGRGTKIDNLVQIGHNVQVGDHCLIIGQVGIGGSTKVGNGVVLAGQVGVADNSEIGDKAMIGAQSGLQGKVAPGSKLLGAPAIDAGKYMKAAGVCLPKLPSLFRRVKKLEKQLEAALKKVEGDTSDE